MSTKTLRKRIALVAVAALGAGVLSVAPASATDNAAVGGVNAGTAAGILNVATTASITGAAVVSSTIASNRSLGLLANSTTLTTSSLTSTATMRSDGAIVFYWTGNALKKAATAVVEGGTITDSSSTGGTANVKNLNAAKTQLVGVGDDAAEVLVFAVTPNAGATSMTVSLYESAVLTSGNAADIAAIQAGTTSKGTLSQRYVVTVAATSSSGAYSSVYSAVHGVVSASTTTNTNVDEADSLTIANAASAAAFIAIDLRDAYNVSLDSVGALVISGTNGAGIYYAGSASAGTPTNFTAVSIDTSGTITVARPTAKANKAFSTTVTISWNGQVVGTKTVTFQGEVAKIVAGADAYSLRAGATSDGSVNVTYVDDAGNALIPQSGTSVVSTSLNQYVTNATVSYLPSVDDPTAYLDVTCAGTATTASGTGSATLQFQHVNALSGTIIKSGDVKVTCAGDPATYTAAFDKAVYAPGDIAILTITGKDLKGALAQGTINKIQSTVSGSEFAVTASQMTPVTAISTTSVKLSSGTGIKTYKFVVGNTEGSYNAVVAIPLINALLLGGTNQTVAYKVVAPSTGAVSNADVLKAIVSLIASINKQIAALQKALLKK